MPTGNEAALSAHEQHLRDRIASLERRNRNLRRRLDEMRAAHKALLEALTAGSIVGTRQGIIGRPTPDLLLPKNLQKALDELNQ